MKKSGMDQGEQLTGIAAALLLILLSSSALAGVGGHTEDFRSLDFMDATHTNAFWDTTGTGSLTLSPLALTAAGSFPGVPARNLTTDGNWAYVIGGDSLRVLDVSRPDSLVQVGSFGTTDSRDIAISGDHALIADGNAGLLALNIENPALPGLLDGYDTASQARGIAVAGDHAFVASDSYVLQVVDISNPEELQSVGDCGSATDGHDLAIAGDHAFVACGHDGLKVVSIVDPTQPTEIASHSWSGHALDVAVSGNQAFVCGSDTLGSVSGLLIVLNIGDPENPSPIGSFVAGTTPFRHIVLDGDYAYLTSESLGLVAVDIGEPTNLTESGSFVTPGTAAALAVAGDIAFVADGDAAGIQVVNIAARVIPPLLVAQLPLPGSPTRIAISGNHAYIGDVSGGCLKVVDIASPTNPMLVDTFDTPGDAQDIAIRGDYAYVADGKPALTVLDLSDPAHPKTGGHVKTRGKVTDVAIDGDVAYISVASTGAPQFNGFYVIDISEPAYPDSTDGCYISGLGRYANALEVQGGYVYLADDAAGLQVIDILDCSRSTYNTPGSAKDVVIVDSYAYVADGESGLQVIDVSNPDSLSFVGSFDTPGTARAVTVHDNLALVADDGGGLLILDISNPASPDSVAHVATHDAAYDVAVDSTFAYVAIYSSGLLILDISNPSSPDSVAAYDASYWSSWGNAYVGVTVNAGLAYVTDTMSGLHIIDVSNPVQPDSGWACRTPGNAVAVTVAGNYAYVADSEHGLRVVDVSNHRDPNLIHAFDSQGYSYCVTVAGDRAFFTDSGPTWHPRGLIVADITDPVRPTLAGWNRPVEEYYDGSVGDVVVSGDRAYVTDHWSNLQAYDISDPSDPYSIGECAATSRAFGLAVSGDHAYVASNHYGFNVVDITDPENMEVVGRLLALDTEPANVALSGNYAFLASDTFGLVVVDVSNPTDPQILSSHDMPSARDVAVEGDYAYVTDSETGLWVYSVFSRQSLPDSNVARSLPLDQTEETIVRASLGTSQVDLIEWELSGDGTSWTDATPGSDITVLSSPGTDIYWRGTLFPIGMSTIPRCDSLHVEWWFDCPLIDAVRDIPDDQGGWMRISFTRSGYDFFEDESRVTSYHVWRRIESEALRGAIRAASVRLDGATKQAVTEEAFLELPDFGPGYQLCLLEDRVFLSGDSAMRTDFPEDWELVATVPGMQEETYSVAVPTTQDSSGVDLPWSVYRVTAHREDPSLWYASPADSGYSVDDIGPSAPRQIRIIEESVIVWGSNEELDLDHYTIHMTPDAQSVEGAITLAQTDETRYALPDSTIGSYLFVTATDLSGNESEPSDLVRNPGRLVPTRFALAQNAPNPFNPGTTIRFALPEPSAVRLVIHDASGRVVAIPAEGTYPAGEYAATWGGRDTRGREVSSGIYFYKLEAGSFTATRKMVLLR